MEPETTIPQQVLDLIEHLRSTGTGQKKLDAIAKLGAECPNGDAFLARVHTVVPEGTLVKVKEYVAAQRGPDAVAEVAEPEPEPDGPSETEEARDHERDALLKQNPTG